MKPFDRWKQEWWLKHAAELASEFRDKELSLIRECEKEIKSEEAKWKDTKDTLFQRIKLEEEDLSYKLKVVNKNKIETSEFLEELKKNNASDLSDIKKKHDLDLQSLKDDYSNEYEQIELNWTSKKDSFLKRIKLEEEEITYRLATIENRKNELIKTDNDLKIQIAKLEGKASPSNVWAEAFTAGFNKSWDMMLPIMTGGVEKLKKSIEDKAIEETLGRMNGNHKKIN